MNQSTKEICEWQSQADGDGGSDPNLVDFEKFLQPPPPIEIPNSKSNRLIESMSKNNSMLPDFELIRN